MVDNRGMQYLRHFTLLSRLVLAWFVLSLGVAVASPLVIPKDVHQLCLSATGGTQTVDADGENSGNTHLGSGMHCPLCVPAGAPPPPVIGVEFALQPLSYALQGIPSAHVAARTAAPLSARGPPTL